VEIAGGLFYPLPSWNLDTSFVAAAAALAERFLWPIVGTRSTVYLLPFSTVFVAVVADLLEVVAAAAAVAESFLLPLQVPFSGVFGGGAVMIAMAAMAKGFDGADRQALRTKQAFFSTSAQRTRQAMSGTKLRLVPTPGGCATDFVRDTLFEPPPFNVELPTVALLSSLARFFDEMGDICPD
jgi:hypothetical protein